MLFSRASTACRATGAMRVRAALSMLPKAAGLPPSVRALSGLGSSTVPARPCQRLGAVPERRGLSTIGDKVEVELSLVEAASGGDTAAMEVCLNAGADVNTIDYDKRTALHLTVAEGHLAAVKWLIEEKGAAMNHQDRLGITPLEEALITRRSHDMVRYLREAGAEIHASRLPHVLQMVLKAAEEGDVDFMTYASAAGVDLGMADYDGRTPLHISASEGNVTTVEYLLKQGVDMNAVDRFGNTPLQDTGRGIGRGFKAAHQVLREFGGHTSSRAIYAGATLSTSLHNSMSILCTRGAFVAAEAFLPTSDGGELRSNGVHVELDHQAAFGAFFAEECDGRRVAMDSSNPLGQAWSSGAAVAAAAGEEVLPQRSAKALAVGLVHTVSVPVMYQGKCAAVFVFYNTADTKHTEPCTFSDFTTFTERLVQAGFFGISEVPHFDQHPEIRAGQAAEVYELIIGEGVFNANMAYDEVSWFYSMGIQNYYFKRFSSKVLARHIHSFIAAKVCAIAASKPGNIWVHIENNPSFHDVSGPEQVLFMVPNNPRAIGVAENQIVKRIALIPDSKATSLDFFLAEQPASPAGGEQIGIYVLETHDYANPAAVIPEETNIWDLASEVFLKDKTIVIRQKYADIIAECAKRLSPITKVYPTYKDGTVPVMIAFKQGAGTNTSYMLQLSELLKQNNLSAHRKFIETFSNGMVVYSLYLKACPQGAEKVARFLEQFSMLHLIPNSSLTKFFLKGAISPEVYTWCSSSARFCYYFINQRSDEFDALNNALAKDPISKSRLNLLHTGLKREAASQARIHLVQTTYPRLMERFTADFIKRVESEYTEIDPAEDLLRSIQKEALNDLDKQVLVAMLNFNKAIRKTNFFKTRKASLSFRLDPAYLQMEKDWPTVPYAIYFVMGSDFQGFHVRFRDISRGGIRIIKSSDQNAYNNNLATLFTESYGLAYTQNKKNKDIPEFGSKGTILLGPNHQGNEWMAFRKYISGLMCLLKDHPSIVDNLKKEELLFLGPDEGTADMMEFAAKYAQEKGYPYWSAFTTGKPQQMGGIPHDKFGMTTRSVHRYVLGCLRKLGLEEAEVTKVQTGGPDGDLGSNEILISKDKTKAVVDGSGVLFDPEGLDRTELGRLATQRLMINSFDSAMLGPGGFKVLVADKNITLPNGEVVDNGMMFRNEFHLHDLCQADLFVPCGGRPESINLSNVDRMFKEDGSPKFKIVVEGANLFLTNDARMVLEEAGVVLYKDASTNKGGVTSSSLEVLAALAMDSAQFKRHMSVEDPANPPAFYQQYVKEIQTRLERDADMEFECVWKEHERTGTPRYVLTETVSDKINDLNDFIRESHLWDNVPLRKKILKEALPKSLTDLCGLGKVMERVPEAYLRATFSAHLASRYVYVMGPESHEFAFFEFMQPYLRE